MSIVVRYGSGRGKELFDAAKTKYGDRLKTFLPEKEHEVDYFGDYGAPPSMMQSPCCDEFEFESRFDPGTVEGVECTLGVCRSCGTSVMSCWICGGVALGYGPVDTKFAERLIQTEDLEKRKILLREWLNQWGRKPGIK